MCVWARVLIAVREGVINISAIKTHGQGQIIHSVLNMHQAEQCPHGGADATAMLSIDMTEQNKRHLT